ncbi:MAG: hypothetical protein ACRCTG_11215 [Aestuariivirga sp.]
MGAGQLFLSDEIKITKLANATAAGTTAINSAVVDMAGYDGCLFLTNAGAIVGGGVQSLKVQQDTVVGMGTAADLAGTGITVADDDDNQAFWIDVKRPRERFLRLVISRATQNSDWGAIWAFQYRGRSLPVVNTVTDTITGEKWEAPAEGAA